MHNYPALDKLHKDAVLFFFVIILYLMLTRIFTPTVYPALKQTEVKQIG